VRVKRIFRAIALKIRSVTEANPEMKNLPGTAASSGCKTGRWGQGPTGNNPFFPEMVGASGKANAPTAPGKMSRAARGKKTREKTMYDIRKQYDFDNRRGGISSDDPNALEKLRTKLAEAEHFQNFMKQVNSIIKNYPTTEMRIKALLPISNYEEPLARQLLEPDYAGRFGFKAYQLTNNSAEIRRIRERIAELEKAALRQDKEEVMEKYTYREDTTENRLMFIFDGKPGENIRVLLKGRGFKWSPTRNAWVRQWTDNALYAAQYVKASLASMV
jgi:hypothetical protein